MTCDAQHAPITFDGEACPLCEMRRQRDDWERFANRALAEVIKSNREYTEALNKFGSILNGPANVNQPCHHAEMPSHVPAKIPTRLEP